MDQMDRLISLLIVFCVIVVIGTNSMAASEYNDESTTQHDSSEPLTLSTTTIMTMIAEQDKVPDGPESPEEIDQQRSIEGENADSSLNNNADRHAAFRKRVKPLKSIFMGIYNNYKSTYLGNKTIEEYKRTLRLPQNEQRPHDGEEELAKVEETKPNHDMADDDDTKFTSTEMNSYKVEEEKKEPTSKSEMKSSILTTKTENNKKKQRKKQRSRKRNHRRKKHGKRHLVQSTAANHTDNNASGSHVYTYDFGPAVNMSLDLNNEIVKLNLNGENLQNLMQGRWLKDRNEGRGKKNEMIMRVLPLFIIPFLIQSAIVPFIVMKLKLLIMKSILVGKLAIFLLVLSAIRNSSKGVQTYEVAPSYWAGEPSRRSELAAAGSSAAYNGYRVEGKPTAWIN